MSDDDFIFVGADGNAYRCYRWEDGGLWLFRWLNRKWVSVSKLTDDEANRLPHNLTEKQQALYHQAEDTYAR